MVRRITAVLFALLVVTPLTTGAAQDNSATAVVERFQNELLSVMKQADQLGYQGRYKRLAPAVRASHDLTAIVQISVGSYWDKLNDKEQAKLVETFAKLSISTYARRFDGYSGQTFETRSSSELSPHVASVSSIFRQPDGEEHRFDYVLRQNDGGFQIVNIVVDGVSDLALKRSEYAGTLRNKGFDALISRLKEKIAENTEAPS
jgi:phospholipid transport system substrate-binding protein